MFRDNDIATHDAEVWLCESLRGPSELLGGSVTHQPRQCCPTKHHVSYLFCLVKCCIYVNLGVFVGLSYSYWDRLTKYMLFLQFYDKLNLFVLVYCELIRIHCMGQVCWFTSEEVWPVIHITKVLWIILQSFYIIGLRSARIISRSYIYLFYVGRWCLCYNF